MLVRATFEYEEGDPDEGENKPGLNLNIFGKRNSWWTKLIVADTDLVGGTHPQYRVLISAEHLESEMVPKEHMADHIDILSHVTGGDILKFNAEVPNEADWLVHL